VESLLFYHPVVHWISREVRNEREACCDDLVLRLGADPVDYAETLASLEELRGVTHAPALAASGGFLLGRIRRIVGVEPLFSAPLSGGQGVLALALAFAAFLAVRPVTTDVLGLTETSATDAPAMPVSTTVAQVAAAAVMRPIERIERSLATPTATAVAAPAVETISEAAPVEAPLSTSAELPRIAQDLRAERPQFSGETSVSDIAPAVLRAKPELASSHASDARTLITKRVAPAFPRHARLAGVEGFVSLTFIVDSFGIPQEIQVSEAYPQRMFNSSAVAALREWRFNPDLAQHGKRYTQTFDFSLTDHPRTPVVEAEQPCMLITGSRICRRGANALEAGISSRVVIENPRETMLPASGMRLGGPGK
jgi:TonB family protein